MLVAVAQRHGNELQADFWRFFGIRRWRDLPASEAAALCEAMIRQPESWTHRAINPHWQWERPETHLTALCADYLALLMWARTEDGQKNRNRPHPVPRPGAEGAHTPGQSTGTDHVALPVDQLQKALARPRH